MLLFLVLPENNLGKIRLSEADIRGYGSVFIELEDAEQHAGASDVILVADLLSVDADLDRDLMHVPIPADCIMNMDPYRPPKPVTAGGGYVVRDDEGHRQVLLMYRRGHWDLAKGKQDKGESPAQTALREVSEETGLSGLSILRSLGTTLHAYPLGDTCAVKTTYWYMMEADSGDLLPQQSEGILKLEWIDLDSATRMLDYPSLKHHIARVYDILRHTELETRNRA